MKSQHSRRALVCRRIATWLYFALWPLQVIAAWMLRGRPELFFSWLYLAKYLMMVCVGFQFVAVVLVIRSRGIVPVILILTGGLLWLGFTVFLQMWMLLLAVVALIAGGFCVTWPQTLELLHRMAQSYREIAKSATV